MSPGWVGGKGARKQSLSLLQPRADSVWLPIAAIPIRERERVSLGGGGI